MVGYLESWVRMDFMKRSKKLWDGWFISWNEHFLRRGSLIWKGKVYFLYTDRKRRMPIILGRSPQCFGPVDAKSMRNSAMRGTLRYTRWRVSECVCVCVREYLYRMSQKFSSRWSRHCEVWGETLVSFSRGSAFLRSCMRSSQSGALTKAFLFSCLMSVANQIGLHR